MRLFSQPCHFLWSPGPMYFYFTSLHSPPPPQHCRHTSPQIQHFLQSQDLCTSCSLYSSPDLSMTASSSSFQPLSNITSSTTSSFPPPPTPHTIYHSTILSSPQYLFIRFTQIMLVFSFHACISVSSHRM